MPDAQIRGIVEWLALADIDVEPERCDPVALRSNARAMLALADALEGRPVGLAPGVRAVDPHGDAVVVTEVGDDGRVYASYGSLGGEERVYAPDALRPF